MRAASYLLAGCLFLASCGGGGGTSTGASGGGNSGSSQPPTSSGLTTGEIKPTSDATYISATMELTTSIATTNQTTGQTSGGTTSDRSITINTPQFTGTYNSQSGYRLSDAVNTAIFGPSQLIGDTTSATQYPTVTFANLAPPVEDYLALYKESVTSSSIDGSGTFTPRYGGIGGWQHTVTGPSSKRTRLDYFAFGPATSSSSMPRSGVVKFFVFGSGNFATDSDLFFTEQGSEVDANFDNGTISGSLNISGRNFYRDETGGLISLGVGGSISGNSVDAPVTSTFPGLSGQFHVLFVGPNADELILTYVAEDGRETIVGSSVGVRDPYQ